VIVGEIGELIAGFEGVRQEAAGWGNFWKNGPVTVSEWMKRREPIMHSATVEDVSGPDSRKLLGQPRPRRTSFLITRQGRLVARLLPAELPRGIPVPGQGAKGKVITYVDDDETPQTTGRSTFLECAPGHAHAESGFTRTTAGAERVGFGNHSRPGDRRLRESGKLLGKWRSRSGPGKTRPGGKPFLDFVQNTPSPDNGFRILPIEPRHWRTPVIGLGRTINRDPFDRILNRARYLRRHAHPQRRCRL